MSEFSGETRDNTVQKKSRNDRLEPWEKLRLIHTTGSEDVTTSADGGRSQQGLARRPDSIIDTY